MFNVIFQLAQEFYYSLSLVPLRFIGDIGNRTMEIVYSASL